MKTSRAFALAMAALIASFVMAHWCAAQPSSQPASREPASYDFGALQQLESFVTYLQETKQTNILQRFDDYSNASIASRQYADLGVTLLVLRELRNGRTNQVYELLEDQMNSDIIGFAASYRDLPASLRDQTSLKVLGQAREYHAKYPSQSHSQIIDDGVAKAFKVLDENTSK